MGSQAEFAYANITGSISFFKILNNQSALSMLLSSPKCLRSHVGIADNTKEYLKTAHIRLPASILLEDEHLEHFRQFRQLKHLRQRG